MSPKRLEGWPKTAISLAGKRRMTQQDVILYMIVVMSTISKRKDKHFDIEAYYRNESKTFWFGPLTIKTKAKQIDVVQRIFYCEQIVSVWAQNFWDEAKQFDMVWKLF